MTQVINYLFKSTLMLFILGGILLVAGQIIGLIIGNSNLISASYELLANPTFIVCAFAAIFGFILQYLPKK